jgi:hypothetical protein
MCPVGDKKRPVSRIQKSIVLRSFDRMNAELIATMNLQNDSPNPAGYYTVGGICANSMST